LLWLFDFLIFEQFWWNGEGGEGLAQELPGGKDDIGRHLGDAAGRRQLLRRRRTKKF